MSACEHCRSAAEARSGTIARLESSGAPTAMVRAELDRIASAVAAGEPQGEGGEAGALWAICRHDIAYPDSLTQFERAADIPHVLYGVGSRELIGTLHERPSIAIVGARRASAYGREVAYQLGRDAAEHGITVVSGMALGIDGAAHRGALQGGGSTIAVLAGSADRPYPRSHRLLHEQIAASGAVVSEMPAGAETRRWSFVARNRLIAALSAITIWVEGSESSGARHTVAFAEELGVPVGVVPGPITSPISAGPNALLGEPGVLPIRGLADVLDVLGICEPAQSALPLGDVPGGPRADVLAQVAAGQRDPRSLAAALPNLAPREISQLLGELELGGFVRRVAGGEYELVSARARE